MNTLLFVSAFYRLDDRPYTNDILERLKLLAKHIHINLFCSEKDVEILRQIPNISLYVKEFETFETYKILSSTTKLPEQRCPIKDTKEFMILMNMKTECLALMKGRIQKNSSETENLSSNLVNYFIWLDAGISKIFKDPDTIFSELPLRLMKASLPNMILLPGCWGPFSDINILSQRIHWRFCGGFICVPNELILQFHEEVLQGCQEIKEKTDKSIWEVNIWAYIESRLPIEWRKGDHNESIFPF